MGMTAQGEGQRTGTVLVVGAGGFIGGYLVSALRARGWHVLLGMRAARSVGQVRACDLARLTTPASWQPLLEGVDVVVNAAGILREGAGQSFQVVHHDAPLALARACAQGGVRRFVQVSALGLPQDGAFIASKHAFDAELLALPLSAVVLRPSVVYSASGSYGGTSLLRALAAFPGASLLPGHARWPVQPLAAEDLGEVVAAAAGGDVQGVFEVGGPRPMPLRDYQLAWRRWLRIAGQRALAVPQWMVAATVVAGEWLGRGPVSAIMWAMLRRGNVTAPDAHLRVQAAFGVRMRGLEEALDGHPSQVQDRWHAQLYFLAPALRLGVLAVFAVSAVAGWTTAAAKIEAMSAGSALAGWHPVLLARAAGVLDALLAFWLASGRHPRAALGAMLALVAAYTLVLGTLLPAQWLEPTGGLLKNLALLPALAVLWVLSDRR